MNRVFTTVWNTSLGTWVVASEHATRRGKSARCGSLVAMALVSSAVFAPLTFAASLPTGGQIVQGNGQIGTPSGNQMVIDQTSNKLTINWQSFDIGTGKRVVFNQPGTDSIALNRVLGADGSKIMGQLDANGRVFLINPNGVLFGAGAQVNVGGLVASTLDISDSDFAAGNYRFKGNASNASVINQGTLKATDGGAIALLGGTVSNRGTIVANRGTVALAAGNAVTLDFAGDGLLNVKVDEALIDALVENHQLIKADGGQVLLTANAGEALLKTVVNNTGVIEAKTLGTKNGKIVLLGGFDGGSVQVAGKLDASAPTGGNGGFIETSGAHVKIANGTTITTQAQQGQSGTWLLDPTDIVIGSGGTMSGATLGANLKNNGNVTLDTSGPGNAGGTDAGNITINDAVAWDSSSTLTLKADNNIQLNAAITASNGGLTLNAQNTIGTSANGAVNVGTFTLASGNWKQLGSTLPAFSARDFRLNGGTFLRAKSGDGSATPWQLTDVYGLQGMSGFLDKNFSLANNIDASGTASWNGGLGFNSIGSSTLRYSGTFDGLNHTISGLTINRPTQDYVGLFSSVANNGAIRNVGLVGGSVAGNYYIGGLAGKNFGTLDNAYTTGTVTGVIDVGGLVGDNAGAISNAYATGAIKGTYSIGGLVGNNQYGNIRNAYATGAVTGLDYAGGLIGTNQTGIVDNVYATGTVTANNNVGGLIGFNQTNSTVSNAYATGAVSGDEFVGGLVGLNTDNSTIRDAYATGAVSGRNSVGGLVGRNYILSTISNTYATGAVTGSTEVGGLVGAVFNSIIQDSAWDKDSTGQAQAVGSQLNFPGMTALDASNRYSHGSYSNLGTWSETFSGSGIWVASTGADKQWIMIEGQTRPFRFSEYSTTVTNVHQLQLMAYDLSANYTLANNIDAGATAGSDPGGMWSALGFSPVGTSTNEYKGIFDGLNHTISGMTINRPMQNFVSLFGATIGATIRNVGLLGGSITGLSGVGGLIGTHRGTLDNVYSTAAVKGSRYVGGLVGYNYSAISNAYATGTVTGTDFVGGLVGYNNGTVSNAYATGAVTGNDRVGGLAGVNLKAVSNAYATGAVTGNSSIGGLVGYNQDEISNAYATGTVTGNSYLGGLAGNNDGTITNSFYATTATDGTPINTGAAYRGNAFGTAKTWFELTQSSTFADWNNLDTQGGTGNTWRLYEGQGTPLLRSFLTAITVDVDTTTITGKTYDGTKANGSFTYTTDQPDAVLDGNGTYTSSSANAGTYNSANGGLSLGGLYSGQQGYDISYTSSSLTIDKATLTVSGMTADNKVYDGTRNAVLTGGTLNGLVGGETLGFSAGVGTFNHQNAGTGKSITVSGSTLLDGTGLASNYTVVEPTNVTADITKAALLVTANDASKVSNGVAWHGGNGVNYSGLVNGESDSVLNGSLTYGGNAQGAINAGTYDLSVNGLSADNYAITFVDGTLSISPGTGGTPAPALPTAYGDTLVSLNIHHTDEQNALDLTVPTDAPYQIVTGGIRLPKGI